MPFFKKKKVYLFLFFFCFSLLFVANYFLDNKVSKFFKLSELSFLSAIHERINPFFYFFSNGENINLTKKDETIAELREENFILKNRINDLASLSKENQELKELLSIKTNLDSSYALSRIISYEPQNGFLSLVIDKGKKNAIENDAVVVGFTGDSRFLVGFVRRALDETSIVQTILNKETQVTVQIGEVTLRSNTIEDAKPNKPRAIAKGILQGMGYFSRDLVIDLVDINQINLVGRKVFTSGLGNKYPKGILVGESIAVEKKNYGLFQKIIVKPYVDFFKLEYVLILTKP